MTSLPVFPNQPENPEVKVLQDRLAATNLKMSDLRNQIQAVKQELRMAQKVLLGQSSGLLAWLGLGLGRARLDNDFHSGAWSREHHVACSGSGSRSSNVLPPAL